MVFLGLFMEMSSNMSWPSVFKSLHIHQSLLSYLILYKLGS
jgi:hypothetical protein